MDQPRCQSLPVVEHTTTLHACAAHVLRPRVCDVGVIDGACLPAHKIILPEHRDDDAVSGRVVAHDVLDDVVDRDATVEQIGMRWSDERFEFIETVDRLWLRRVDVSVLTTGIDILHHPSEGFSLGHGRDLGDELNDAHASVAYVAEEGELAPVQLGRWTAVTSHVHVPDLQRAAEGELIPSELPAGEAESEIIQQLGTLLLAVLVIEEIERQRLLPGAEPSGATRAGATDEGHGDTSRHQRTAEMAGESAMVSVVSVGSHCFRERSV